MAALVRIRKIVGMDRYVIDGREMSGPDALVVVRMLNHRDVVLDAIGVPDGDPVVAELARMRAAARVPEARHVDRVGVGKAPARAKRGAKRR